jgi:hypothetical protein
MNVQFATGTAGAFVMRGRLRGSSSGLGVVANAGVVTAAKERGATITPRRMSRCMAYLLFRVSTDETRPADATPGGQSSKGRMPGVKFALK